MKVDISLDLKIETTIAEIPFLALVEDLSIANAKELINKIGFENDNAQLKAGLIVLEAKENGSGVYVLDDLGQESFINLVKVLGCEIETYYNDTMGSYDQYTNRVTPADLGHQFPDGTWRIVWEKQEGSLNKDLFITAERLAGAIDLLIDLSSHKDFTEELLFNDEKTKDELINLRIAEMFDAGFWPSNHEASLKKVNQLKM
jgi:hypothetical protein